jgi:hypothetical protein
VDGKKLDIEPVSSENASWLNDVYRCLNIQYAKFFKMDTLSKAGFLASELIFNSVGLNRDLFHKDIAIVCFNSSASLEVDTAYQQTIQSEDSDNYYPSPSLFVYTLANIVTGEIAIRNKIQGETSFYIAERWSVSQLCDVVTDVFADNSVNGLLCGWVDCYRNHCDVLMMYISN